MTGGDDAVARDHHGTGMRTILRMGRRRDNNHGDHQTENLEICLQGSIHLADSIREHPGIAKFETISFSVGAHPSSAWVGFVRRHHDELSKIRSRLRCPYDVFLVNPGACAKTSTRAHSSCAP